MPNSDGKVFRRIKIGFFVWLAIGILCALNGGDAFAYLFLTAVVVGFVGFWGLFIAMLLGVSNDFSRYAEREQQRKERQDKVNKLLLERLRGQQ